MLNSAEHEILNAHKYENSNKHFAGSEKARMLFFLLINVKMSAIVGILTILGRKNFLLNRVEHENLFITSGTNPHIFYMKQKMFRKQHHFMNQKHVSGTAKPFFKGHPS